MKIRPKCGCGGALDLMFRCSGVADTAEIGDRAVRSVHRTGEAKMYCLAGIASDVEFIVANSRSANRTVVVDGCDSDCAKKTMQKQGFEGFRHFRVTDLGWEKGKTPVTDERIHTVSSRLRGLLLSEPVRAEA
ncbi:MAG TPA: putative zinc-binding protein [Bryobacteraceae bacterium]|nr:putative zinc-binding protein [Bryobacteraceae bacterium]HPT26091.1 putative zinc-binding protein [Bryobacteraceae bacterium]